MGVLVLALLFIGTFAVTRAPRTTSARAANSSVTATLGGAPPAIAMPVATPWDAVFEIEGNAVDNSGFPGLPEDWNDINPGNIPTSQSTSVTGTVVNSAALIRTFISDPPISTDLIYTGGGSKDFNEISDWGQIAKGTGPPKDDIQHAYAAKYLSGGHSFLVFGGDRGTNNGDANLGFWFFQNSVGPNNSGGFDGLHKNGDVFVLSAFSGGGGTSTIRALVWVGTPDTAGPGGSDSGAVARCATYGNGTGVIDPKSDSTGFPAGSLCDITGASPLAGTGITNSAPVAVSWQYKNTDSNQGGKAPAGTGVNCTVAPCTIPQPDFFEGVIDLTELGLATECFASFLLETRSSSEVSAVLKDFALGNFESCSGVCDKTVNLSSGCLGSPVTYTYSTTNTGGTTLGQTLKDDNATPGNSADDFYITGGNGGACTTSSSAAVVSVAPGASFSCTRQVTYGAAGTYIDTLLVHTVAPFDGAVADCSNSATVVVNSPPACSITGNDTICDGGSTSFSGPAGMTTYAWTGPAGFTASTQSTGPISVAGTYHLTITDSNGCSSSCQKDLIVNPLPSCNITGANEICQKDAQGTPNKTAFCGPDNMSSYSWSGPGGFTKATQCTGDISTAGTYNLTITDANGCSSTCNRTLTVNPNPSVSIDAVACDLDGSIALHARPTGGTGGSCDVNNVCTGYTYHWDTGATTQEITVTNPGTHTVVVTDTKSCVSSSASVRVGLCAGQ